MKSIRYYIVDIILSISDLFQMMAVKLSDSCIYRHTDEYGFITLFAIFKTGEDKIVYILGASRK